MPMDKVGCLVLARGRSAGLSVIWQPVRQCRVQTPHPFSAAMNANSSPLQAGGRSGRNDSTVRRQPATETRPRRRFEGVVDLFEAVSMSRFRTAMDPARIAGYARRQQHLSRASVRWFARQPDDLVRRARATGFLLRKPRELSSRGSCAVFAPPWPSAPALRAAFPAAP